MERDQDILINVPEAELRNYGGTSKFKFSRVFLSDASQDEIFQKCILSVLRKLLQEGKNALIFTYGVTNAGKSHTIVGDDERPGILPNTINWLLQMKKILKTKQMTNSCQTSQTDYFSNNFFNVNDLFLGSEENSEYDLIKSSRFKDLDLSLQCFEIYNDELHDLFSKKGMNQKQKKLHIKEINKKLVIENLKTKIISSQKEFSSLLAQCLKNRAILQTSLNKHSSRSHCVYKIYLNFYFENEEENLKVEKSLTLVDLAGSERCKRTENRGSKLKEANKINQSLSCLGRCMKALNQKTIPPFRETKLTRYLSEFFVEDNNIIMIANINPRMNDFEESMRALNYTAVAREIRTLPSRFSLSIQ